MTVLKFIQGDDKEVGMISFFGVYPTSLSKKYKYCSSDNKGYVTLKFERAKKSTYGKGDFLQIQTQAICLLNLNMPDPKDYHTDTTVLGKDQEESANIIGERQYVKALELYQSVDKQLKGSVQSITRYCDYSDVEIEPKFANGTYRNTCIAALE